MERPATPLKRVTSLTGGPPPSCKQALKQASHVVQSLHAGMRETQLGQGKQRLHIIWNDNLF